MTPPWPGRKGTLLATCFRPHNEQGAEAGHEPMFIRWDLKPSVWCENYWENYHPDAIWRFKFSIFCCLTLTIPAHPPQVASATYIILKVDVSVSFSGPSLLCSTIPCDAPPSHHWAPLDSFHSELLFRSFSLLPVLAFLFLYISLGFQLISYLLKEICNFSFCNPAMPWTLCFISLCNCLSVWHPSCPGLCCSQWQRQTLPCSTPCTPVYHPAKGISQRGIQKGPWIVRWGGRGGQGPGLVPSGFPCALHILLL